MSVPLVLPPTCNYTRSTSERWKKKKKTIMNYLPREKPWAGVGPTEKRGAIIHTYSCVRACVCAAPGQSHYEFTIIIIIIHKSYFVFSRFLSVVFVSNIYALAPYGPCRNNAVVKTEKKKNKYILTFFLDFRAYENSRRF